MGMPDSPVKVKSELQLRQERRIEAVSKAAASGMMPPEIARQMYPGKTKKAAKKRRVMRSLLYQLGSDPAFIESLHNQLKGRLQWAMAAVMNAAVERAVETGRPESVKFLAEATGFHAPRVEHEHSGDINITLAIPRPELPKHVDSTAEEQASTEPQPTNA